jgi:hypothetical protein
MSRTFYLDLIDFTRTTPEKVIYILSFLESRFGEKPEKQNRE